MVLVEMSTYDEILKSADPICCYRKNSVTPIIVALENFIISILFLITTILAVGMRQVTIAKFLAIATFYMMASTSVYIYLMITQKPSNNLNHISESTNSDSHSEEDYNDMPALTPISSTNDRVLRQLQQVVDETNARNQMRMTRSMYAKTAAGITTTSSFENIKKIN